MSDAPSDRVPEGFERVPEGLGYTDTLQPLYRRADGESVSYGLRVERQHGNSMGICHGGVLMTLADIAAASGVNLARGALAGAPTINLGLDFLAPARMGQWLQSEIQNVEVKRRFGFCSGILRTREAVVARFNGTFYLPDHDGMWRDGKRPIAAVDGLPQADG